MAPPNARMMTSWIFMARSRAAAASTIVTSLIDDGCSATPGKSGHFTCSRERTDHVLPTFWVHGAGVDTVVDGRRRSGAYRVLVVVVMSHRAHHWPPGRPWRRSTSEGITRSRQ